MEKKLKVMYLYSGVMTDTSTKKISTAVCEPDTFSIYRSQIIADFIKNHCKVFIPCVLDSHDIESRLYTGESLFNSFVVNGPNRLETYNKINFLKDFADSVMYMDVIIVEYDLLTKFNKYINEILNRIDRYKTKLVVIDCDYSYDKVPVADLVIDFGKKWDDTSGMNVIQSDIPLDYDTFKCETDNKTRIIRSTVYENNENNDNEKKFLKINVSHRYNFENLNTKYLAPADAFLGNLVAQCKCPPSTNAFMEIVKTAFIVPIIQSDIQNTFGRMANHLPLILSSGIMPLGFSDDKFARSVLPSSLVANDTKEVVEITNTVQNMFLTNKVDYYRNILEIWTKLIRKTESYNANFENIMAAINIKG